MIEMVGYIYVLMYIYYVVCPTLLTYVLTLYDCIVQMRASI